MVEVKIPAAAFGLALATFLPLASCQNDHVDQQQVTSKNSGASDNQDQDSDTNLSAEQRNDWWSKNTGSAAAIGDVSATTAAVAKDPYFGCGYSASDLTKSLAIANLSSTPTRLVGSNYTLNGAGSLGVNASQGAGSLIMNFNITDGSSSTAVSRGRQAAVRYSSTNNLTNLTQAETQTALGRTSANPACGFLFTRAMNIKSTDGKTYVNVSFDQPVPYMISPTLSKDRMAYELKSKFATKTVTATINTNDSQVAKGGTTQTGTIEVFLLDATQAVTDSQGATTNYSVDYAYRVASKFQSGSGGSSGVGWLDQVTDYYVKGGSIVGAVVRLPNKELQIIVYK